MAKSDPPLLAFEKKGDSLKVYQCTESKLIAGGVALASVVIATVVAKNPLRALKLGHKFLQVCRGGFKSLWFELGDAQDLPSELSVDVVDGGTPIANAILIEQPTSPDILWISFSVPWTEFSLDSSHACLAPASAPAPRDAVASLSLQLADLSISDVPPVLQPPPRNSELTPRPGAQLPAFKARAAQQLDESHELKPMEFRSEFWSLPNNGDGLAHLWIFSYNRQEGAAMGSFYTHVKTNLQQLGWFDLGNSSYLKWTGVGELLSIAKEIAYVLVSRKEVASITYVSLVRATPSPSNCSAWFVDYLLKLLHPVAAKIGHTEDKLNAHH